MKTIAKYDEFNSRRYGNPWVALVNPKTAKIDFSQKVGGYTGSYNKGEAGELYIIDPKDGAVYAYGQKDYRGSNSECNFIKCINGEFVPVDKKELIAALQ